MNYSEIIQTLANNIIVDFDEVWYNAETIVNNEGIRLPAVPKNEEYIPLAPTDQREIIYIRRNGEDEVIEEAKIGSCTKAYKMRSQLRVVYFRDHAKQHNKILHQLMQSVLVQGTKLKTIIQNKWKLQKDESSGDYNFGASTAYFAIDIYINWDLFPDTCEEDFCIEGENPLKKKLLESTCETFQINEQCLIINGDNIIIN